MDKDRPAEFLRALEFYLQKGYNPTFGEITSMLDRSDSKYWRKVSTDHLNSGRVIKVAGQRYAYPTPGITFNGQAPSFDKITLNNMADKSIIIDGILELVNHYKEGIPSAQRAVLEVVEEEELLFRYVEFWVLYTFIKDPHKIPRVERPALERDGDKIVEEIQNTFSKLRNENN